MLKKLWSETLIYGLSTVLGRMIYFLLNRLHTDVFSKADVGILVSTYALIGFCLVLFTYRMEAAYFRYATDKEYIDQKVLNTSISSISLSTILFSLLFFMLIPWFGSFYGLESRPEVLWLALIIIALDTLSEIPFAYLRLHGKAKLYSVLKILNIFLLIFFNVLFLWILPKYIQSLPEGLMSTLIHTIYSPKHGILYVLIANIIGSLVVLLLALKKLPKIEWEIDYELLKKMWSYSWPLVIVSFSYIINEMFDRLFMVKLLPGTMSENQEMTAIYGSCYRLTIFINLFTMAYRLGAEPFFLKTRNEANAPALYARATLYFTIFACTGFLFTVLFTPQLKSLVFNSSYDSGLIIVPIVTLANVFNGLYYNLSIWYRTTDNTRLGIYFSLFGAITTIVLNVLFIPYYGYIAAAWTTLICYFLMCVLVYYAGKKYIKIPYNWRKINGIFTLSIFLVLINKFIGQEFILIPIFLFILYGLFIYFLEKETILSLKSQVLSRFKR